MRKCYCCASKDIVTDPLCMETCPVPAKTRTILHVDDSSVIRELVKVHYRKQGYEVISLDDPSKVLGTLLTHNCQVIISDIEMEPIDGMTLLQQIKKEDGGLAVIMLTGVIGTNTILRSMRWGADACIFKPLKDFTRLDKAVEAAFEKHDQWWESLQEAQAEIARNKSQLERITAEVG